MSEPDSGSVTLLTEKTEQPGKRGAKEGGMAAGKKTWLSSGNAACNMQHSYRV
ncbi:hypothetical protein LJN55_08680 [Erwinia rhapontici]|uniref:hypothetical protein n=1 Tax=Erwinia rhapontici TaxID=55212 RepID=UPI001D0DA442|nr:hypothetical protein [Erwinia rhapontici]UDQ81892.1 hypothetical protein LJN55_08680 [Erwinia rhapontici]